MESTVFQRITERLHRNQPDSSTEPFQIVLKYPVLELLRMAESVGVKSLDGEMERSAHYSNRSPG